MKLSIRNVIMDLSDEFLCEIIKRESWTREEIVEEFQRASYHLALIYFDKMNEEVKPCNAHNVNLTS